MVGVAFRLTLAKKSLCKPAKHERLNQSGNVPLQVQCCVFLSPGLPFVLDGKAPAQGAGQGGADPRRFQGALQGETAVRIDKMKVNPSLLFFCVRQGRTSCRESFFGIIIAKFSQPKNNKAGNNIGFMTLCKKPVFGSFPRKNSTKSTRKCEETAQERKCSFCAAADLTTL